MMYTGALQRLIGCILVLTAMIYSNNDGTRSFTNIVVEAIVPPHNPPWPPTYNLTQSLITMQVNRSGWSSPESGAQFGIISYDWSNLKDVWAAAKPMNCQELLLEQANLTKQAGGTHVFVYQNMVKALPWFSTVREKLLDPAYRGFFLPFASSSSSSSSGDQQHYHVPPCATENSSRCSLLYHDQEQTPQVPTVQNPNPDGRCVDFCDCGPDLPCGEYLWDHRNGTMLRIFLVNEVVLGTLAAHDQHGQRLVDGFFLDDYWCSNLLCQESNDRIQGCPCEDPAQGPTEVQRDAVTDMGLSDESVRDLTLEWNRTMTAVQIALLQQDAYTWSLMPGQENANAMPHLLTPDHCAPLLRQYACSRDNDDASATSITSPLWQRLPLLFGFTTNGTALVQLDVDLAFFLLARGPYAYAGWGVWGMTWPLSTTVLPRQFWIDYGVPQNVCRELEPGIFERDWTNVNIRLDCNRFQARWNFVQQPGAIDSDSRFGVSALQ